MGYSRTVAEAARLRFDRVGAPQPRPTETVSADPRRREVPRPGPTAGGNGRGGLRWVIIEGDDLGLLYAFNEGIRAAYLQGRLTSTCLRANGYAYEHAIAEILPGCPGLGVGVHLCLNEAGPVAPRYSVSPLLAHGGVLRPGFAWLMRLARTRIGLRAVEHELRAQIEKVLDSGVSLDHLNSHQHVHMIPAIFRITCRLAREYDIPCVRLSRELPYIAGGLRKRVQPFLNSNHVKHVLLNYFARVNETTAREFGIPTTDYFLGVSYTAHMSLQTIRRGLRAAPYGSVEVLLHPAIGPDPRDLRYPHPSLRRYVSAPQRAEELRALQFPALSTFLDRETWMATTFNAWADAQKEQAPAEIWPPVPERIRHAAETTVIRTPLWVSQAQDDSRVFAQLVATQLNPGDRVLDLGTGSGIIAITLARLGHDVLAADISPAALRTAAANARRNSVSFECRRSDLLAALPGRFDLIAFNPPYNFRPDSFAMNLAKNIVRRVPFIRRGSGLAMPRPVLKFHQQLMERLIRQAPEHLRPGGGILLHAYVAEVSPLASVLPAGSTVELLHHPALSNHTVGMLVRLPTSRVATLEVKSET